MSELYGVIGKTGYANLLADPLGADRIMISCEPGEGDLVAGTVMYRKESGLWAAATNSEVTSENMLAVLAEDVAAGTKPEHEQTAVAEEGIAYRAGTFIEGAVTLKAKAALSAENKVVLRLQNIVFGQKETTTTFNNKVSGE